MGQVTTIISPIHPHYHGSSMTIFSRAARTNRPYGALEVFHAGGSEVGGGIAITICIYIYIYVDFMYRIPITIDMCIYDNFGSHKSGGSVEGVRVETLILRR